MSYLNRPDSLHFRWGEKNEYGPRPHSLGFEESNVRKGGRWNEYDEINIYVEVSAWVNCFGRILTSNKNHLGNYKGIVSLHPCDLIWPECRFNMRLFSTTRKPLMARSVKPVKPYFTSPRNALTRESGKTHNSTQNNESIHCPYHSVPKCLPFAERAPSDVLLELELFHVFFII